LCSLQFIKIKQLNDKFANETADVMGVVDRVEPTAVIQTRDGKEVTIISLLTILF